MAGRENKPVYLYGKKGNFIREFKNSVEFCKIFGFNKNFFAVKNSRKVDTYCFPDNRVASLKKIGRDGVLKFLKRTHSPYVGTGKAVSNTKYKKSGDGEVKLFDLDGDEMATFRDLFTAKTLLPKYAQSFSARVKTTDSGIKIVYLKK